MDSQITVVKASGIFDTINGNQLRREIFDLIDQGHQVILIDLQDVELMDSSGLSCLIMIFRKVRDVGGTLGLCGARDQVKLLLEFTKTSDLLKNFSDQAAFASYLASL